MGFDQTGKSYHYLVVVYGQDVTRRLDHLIFKLPKMGSGHIEPKKMIFLKVWSGK